MPRIQPRVSPLTNTVSLPTISAAELVACSQTNTLPIALLPFFLHEYAHHQCFSSAVGNAWASLEAEALSDLRRSLARGVWELPPVARRLHGLNQLLRPILEGLALFAEHDVYPGSSPVTSPLVVWASVLFRDDARMQSATPLTHEAFNQMTQTVLCGQRQQTEWVERKAHLLLQSLDLSNGGYLPGYLTVRNFWLLARTVAPRLDDSNLFLSYATSLLFDDYGMVALLLDEGRDEETRAADMLARLRSRLALLGRKDLDERVAEYERAIDGNTKDRWWLDGHHQCLFLDEATVSANRFASERRLREHLPITEEALQSDELTLASVAALKHHGYRRLAIADATVSVGSDGRLVVTSDGEVVLRAAAEEGAVEGTGTGTLLLYLDAETLDTLFVCTRGPHVVHVRAPGSEGRDDRLTAFIINLALTIEPTLNELLDAIARDVEAGDTGPSPMATAVAEIFQRFALVFVEPGCEPACAEAMARDGFWNIVNGDVKLVRSLALLGLMSSCHRRNMYGPPMFAWHGLDFDSARHQLSEAARRWRYPLITADLDPLQPLRPEDGIDSMV